MYNELSFMRQLLPLWLEVLDNSAIPMTLFRTPYCTDTRVESGNPSIRRPPHTHIIRVPEIPRFPDSPLATRFHVLGGRTVSSLICTDTIEQSGHSSTITHYPVEHRDSCPIPRF